ncbi:MAG: hypothetical protein JEZ03_04555, partial [Bacteroidales bacterium]|nr:hypothetical protein [Bacteroidales bacterium]
YMLSEEDRNMEYIHFELHVELCDGNIKSEGLNVHIAPLAEIEPLNDTSYCLGSQMLLTPEVSNYSSLLWSSDGGGFFTNPSSLNPYFILNENQYFGQENVSITLTAYSQNPCDLVVQSMIVAIIPEVEIEFPNSFIEICETQNQLEITADVSNTDAIFWSSSSDGEFVDENIASTVYFLNQQDVQNGSVVLNCQATGECGLVTEEITVIIHSLVDVTISEDVLTVCESQSVVQVSAQVNNFTSVVWTTSGTGSYNDPTALSCLYSFSEQDIQFGSVVLSCIAYGESCEMNADTANILITFQKEASLDIESEFTVCPFSFSTDEIVNQCEDYSELLWSTNGTGIFENEANVNAIYTPSVQDLNQGGVNLTLTVYPNGPCEDTLAQSCHISFFEEPIFGIEASNSTVCEGDTIVVNAVMSNCMTVDWFSNTSEICFEEHSTYCCYVPSLNDAANGYVEISLLVQANNECYGDSVVSTIIDINVLPEIPQTPTGPESLCMGEVDSSDFFTSISNGAISYIWNLEPDNAGGFIGNTEDSVISVLWNEDYFGEYFIAVSALNDCGENVSSGSLQGVIHENPYPQIIANPGSLVEAGDSIVLSVGEIDLSSFLWHPVMLDLPMITVDSSEHSNWVKHYMVDVFDQFGCVGHDSIDVYFDLNLDVNPMLPDGSGCGIF